MIKFSIFAACFTLLLGCHPNRVSVNDFTPEKIFTNGIEGPVYFDNFLYVVNYQKQGTIGRIDTMGNTELFLEFKNGSIGNSIQVFDKSNLLVADYTNHNLLKINLLNKEVDIYIHDDRMNQPNDIVIRSDKTIYATDPNWNQNTGQLWMITPKKKIALIDSTMGTTNGIALSPDESKLYVNESIQRKIWVYDINKNGELHHKTLFYQFKTGGLDGMKCDVKGNLYVARYGKGKIAVLSPIGKLLREINLKGINPTNLTFGGKQNKTCYVTMQGRGCVEKFINEYEGRK